MLLYLLRHADANTKAASDDERPLSEKGIGQSKRVAKYCEAHDLLPALILTSPIRRAEETARIVAKHLHTECTVAPFLSYGMTGDTALTELKNCRRFKSVMLVGHEPDFSGLVRHLLGFGASATVRIRKASLTELELPTLRAGMATLHFSIPCKLMT